MFGPSEAIINGKWTHHRSQAFHDLLRELQWAFLASAGLDLTEWTVLFVCGSGTTANKTVLSSFNCQFGKGMEARKGMEFSQRLKLLFGSSGEDMACFVGYDTASSNRLPADCILKDAGTYKRIFADMVSAWPYYDIPKYTDVWTTVNCKQLGGPPVLGIIVTRRDLCEQVGGSLGELYSWHEDRRELPHTAPIPLLMDLLERLRHFNIQELRTKIDTRRAGLEAIVPSRHQIGEGPVFTFQPDALPDGFVELLGMYPGVHGPQIFLHAAHDRDYELLYEKLRRIEWR